MNTTVQALQALYVKLGGSLTDTYDDIADGATVADYATIPDMVDAVAKKAQSGGGGGSTTGMIVTFTASGGTYSADKTLSEITEAFTSTKNVIGYNSETGYVLPCVLANSEVAIFSATVLTAASTYTAMSMQVTASSGLIYEQANVELASS